MAKIDTTTLHNSGSTSQVTTIHDHILHDNGGTNPGYTIPDIHPEERPIIITDDNEHNEYEDLERYYNDLLNKYGQKPKKNNNKWWILAAVAIGALFIIKKR